MFLLLFVLTAFLLLIHLLNALKHAAARHDAFRGGRSGTPVARIGRPHVERSGGAPREEGRGTLFRVR